MQALESTLEAVSSFVWGPWLLLPLLLGTGLFLTVRLRGIQFRLFAKAMSIQFGRRAKQSGLKGEISSFQAMATALGATVGTGNIVGVALSISLGGPGALFWMWITALIGMASKYAECFLGVRFRHHDQLGEMTGGPQSYLRRGIPNKFGYGLSIMFAVCCVIACFGIGNMTQSNAIAANLENSFSVPPMTTAITIAILTAIALLGGIKTISKVTGFCVPLMIVIYLGFGAYIVALNYQNIPEAFSLIFTGAFTGAGVAGGAVGSGFLIALQIGAQRSLFSNESGMGTAAIPASVAATSHPVRQGLASMTQTFVDTLVVISMTGFIIITTGTWRYDDPATMTSAAFATGLPGEWGGYIVTFCLVLLGYSTVLGWSYYGERALASLGGGKKALMTYRMVFAIACGLGAVAPLSLVFTFSDVMNGLMAIPNLIGLVILSGLVVRETKLYLEHDPDFEASVEDIEYFMGQHPGALDAQIDHEVDLTMPKPELEHPDTTKLKKITAQMSEDYKAGNSDW
ncbi:sodium:alanine symporter family protein [Rothia sp. ZJ932]|uniref:alanine/glycine:cation symporter family protein n=1 Tax=Rothia sp. ZJ932 TaxID=2810516 RepID=UPI0019683070|nr:sodium:alanine symporter family protein [Rothia sp. ZJ932]QRZ61285.1 sodium:alanine symporter family protein [Rothia sp. ZJ932]